jgi:hypothetical protein
MIHQDLGYQFSQFFLILGEWQGQYGCLVGHFSFSRIDKFGSARAKNSWLLRCTKLFPRYGMLEHLYSLVKPFSCLNRVNDTDPEV